jgi:hypothetical protein
MLICSFSVTSPAAYLGDVLQWIKQRTVTDTSGPTPVPDKSPISGTNPRSLLIDRTTPYETFEQTGTPLRQS